MFLVFDKKMSQYQKMIFRILFPTFLALFVAQQFCDASPLAFAAPIPFPEGKNRNKLLILLFLNELKSVLKEWLRVYTSNSNSKPIIA